VLSIILTVVGLIVIFAFVQLCVHFESKSLHDTRKQRREAKKMQEHNRLFWSIRDLEKDIYGKWLS
jgi:hypothetical protein